MSAYQFPHTPEVPNFDTATDVIDYLTEHVADMVVISNIEAGTMLTAEQFQAAFDRTFDAALVELLARIEKARPELATRIRRQFIAEQDLREQL